MKLKKINKRALGVSLLIIIIAIPSLSYGIAQNCSEQRARFYSKIEPLKNELNNTKLIENEVKGETRVLIIPSCIESSVFTPDAIPIEKSVKTQNNAKTVLSSTDATMAKQGFVLQKRDYSQNKCGYFANSSFSKETTRITVISATYQRDVKKCGEVFEVKNVSEQVFLNLNIVEITGQTVYLK